MKTKAFSFALFALLACLSVTSCVDSLLRSSDSDDPLEAMKALADDAESDAQEWNKSEMKKNFKRSVEIMENFAEHKEDYKKDDLRAIAKDLKRFVKAIDKTDAAEELNDEGFFSDMEGRAKKVSRELTDYFGDIDV
ncbi:MAG: hypothetical protein K6G08_08910 [Prevotella sp.]|nr:hypothetical protein [Prevotella sp.]